MPTTRRASLPIVVALLAAATTAHADRRNPLEGQPSIRHRVEMRQTRFEITPQLLLSTNQDFRHFVGGGLVLQFHIFDWLGVGLQGAFGGGYDSGLTSRIAEVTNNPTANQPTTKQFRDHLATINAVLSAYATLTPFAGKLALFGAAFLKYDLYALVGVGMLYLTNSWVATADMNNCSNNPPPGMQGSPNSCDPLNSGVKVGLDFGAGVHLYFNDWLGLNLEFRDVMASWNPGGLDVNGDRKVTEEDNTLQHSLFFGLGLTFMLPPTAKISQ
jgi:outer membrane beta-barrel protein